MISAAELERMPLDTPEHVRLGWMMLHRPAVRDGLLADMPAAAADEFLARMRRQVRKAAWEHEVLLFNPVPGADAPGDPG